MLSTGGLMDIGIFFTPLIVIAIFLILVQVASLPTWIVKNSFLGAAMLYGFNHFGIVYIKLTLTNCLIAGIFGVPGMLGLIIYYKVF